MTEQVIDIIGFLKLFFPRNSAKITMGNLGKDTSHNLYLKQKYILSTAHHALLEKRYFLEFIECFLSVLIFPKENVLTYS